LADPLTGAIPWSVEEVRAFLRDHGRTPRELGVEQLKSWWFNLVLRVEGDGERLILRRYGITPPEEVRWELALLAHLHAHDFPTIRPLARVDGGRLSEFGGKPAILYPYVEGSNACGPEVDRRHAMTEAAALIGRLSRLTRDLALPHPRARSGANPRRTLCGLSAWAAQRGTRPDEPRFNELVARANGALDEFEARLAPHAAALPRGIVHHDGHCANVLLREGQLVALIDFDDAFEGHLVAELPVLLSNWATHGDDFVQHVEEMVAILRAYHHERPLTDNERELLPEFHLLYNLADTAVEVYERVARGTAPERAMAEWGRPARFDYYLTDTIWRETLRRAVDAF